MREKIQRFMIGRYGADELAKAQSIAALVLLFLSMFSRLGIFYWLAIALMIYSTWRMFSKNISARYAENQKYLNYRYQMAVKWNRFKKQSGTEKTLQILQMSAMQTESESAKRQRKNLHHLSKMPDRICEKKLKIKGDFSLLVISISIKKNYRRK